MAHRASAAAAAAVRARWAPCRASGATPDDAAPSRARSPSPSPHARASVPRESADARAPEDDAPSTSASAPPPPPRAAAGAAAGAAVARRRARARARARVPGPRRPRWCRDARPRRARVNAAIASSRSLAELRRVVEANDLASGFNDVNIATAYSRIGRHVGEDERGSLDAQPWYLALEARCERRLPHLSPWALSSVAWALAKARRDPGEAFWSTLERELLCHVPELEPQGVANVCWAFAAAERRAPPNLRGAPKPPRRRSRRRRRERTRTRPMPTPPPLLSSRTNSR